MNLWADLVQDKSYTFDKVLPYFKRTVQFTPPNQRLRACNATVPFDGDPFYPDGQPLHVTYSNYGMPFSSWMKRGLEAIGIHETKDFNSGFLNGSQFSSSTIRSSDQTRSSSESAFFRSPSARSLFGRLKVYKSTLAKQILFDARKRATGVRVRTGFLTYILSARRGVIISAGAFQSPQLLMVSGIGPADILEEHDIEVISNLPGVGQDLWDHIFFGPTYQVAVETFTKLATDPFFLIEQLWKFGKIQTGMLTNPVTDYLAFEKFPKSLRSSFSVKTEEELAWFPEDWPEIEVSTQSPPYARLTRGSISPQLPMLATSLIRSPHSQREVSSTLLSWPALWRLLLVVTLLSSLLIQKIYR